MPKNIPPTPVSEALRPGLGSLLLLVARLVDQDKTLTAEQFNAAFEAAVREVVDGHEHAVGTHVDLGGLTGQTISVVWKDQR